MFEEALPFWAEEGPDKQYGGFVEALDFSGRDAALPFKRVRVTCRQIYVFSHAYVMGWTDGKDLIADGVSYLVDKAWRGPDQGFVRRLTRDGESLDPTPDLYDHAFALFGFIWAFNATRETAYRDLATATLDVIENKFRRPNGKGFDHELPVKGFRLQNPHMHLTEACLIGWRVMKDDRYKALAVELVSLFKSHFFNHRTGTLAEYFHDDWSIADGREGRMTEPGHQLEWAWILEGCQRDFGVDASDEIVRMMNFSEKFGVDGSTGYVMNTTLNDGAVVDPSSRTWPNTERLKAAIAAKRLGSSAMGDAANQTASTLLDQYLKPQPGYNIPAGGWIDHFAADRSVLAKDMPASTFYHLFLAFAEALEPPLPE